MESPIKKRSLYRPEIDGLRALAVIAVIIYHFNEEIIPNGYLGVDIFYVISGFVVTSSLANKQYDSWKDYLLIFYSRRIKRLIPALIACVVVGSIFSCIFIHNPGVSLKTGIASLLGLSNVFLFHQSTDYFGQSSQLNLFTHTWSLGVEIQFYFVFPIILGLCGFTCHITKKGARNLFFVISILSVASLIGYLYFSQNNPSASFFLTHLRFWELGAGSLTFLGINYFEKSKFNNKKSKYITTYLSFIVCLCLFFLSKDLQVICTVLTTILTSVLIWSLKTPSRLYDLFSSKAIVQIGVLSYSLYLWHWPVTVLARFTIGVSAVTIPLLLVIIIVLSLLSSNFIEKPFRQKEWSRSKIKTIGYGLISSFASIVLLFVFGDLLKGKLYAGRYIEDLQERSLEIDKTYEPCHRSTDLTKCTYSNNKGSKGRTIYFVGDSHILSLQGLASRLLEENNVSRIVMASQPGCIFSTYFAKTAVESEQPTLCRDKNINLVDRIFKEANPGDLVFITSRYKAYFAKPTSKADMASWRKGNFAIALEGETLSQQKALNMYSKELVEVAQRFANKQVSVIVQGPIPDWNSLPANCLPEWFRLQKNICNLDFISQKQTVRPIQEAFAQAQKRSSNLYVYQPFSLFCNENNCSPISSEGVPLFYDENHLNNYGAKYMYEDFVKFLNNKFSLDS